MMKKLSNEGLELIKAHEGLRLQAYKCPAGVWTIGYGHTKGVKEGMVITQAQADQFLREDVEVAEVAVNRQMLNINQHQFDALVSFAFNCGVAAFERSTLLKKIKVDPNDPTIAAEFSRWNKGGGVVLAGLVRRRSDEAKLYNS